MLREKKTGDLIICDHKSKSMTSFKKDEDKMYRQQLLYSTYVVDNYGEWPARMMFHLFNESGVKPERLFSLEAYRNTVVWATEQIKKIEDYTVIDWLQCKEKPDYYCWELCGSRKQCPNGVKPDFRSKKRRDFDEFGEE